MVLFACLMPKPGAAESEDEIKAAFLFHFARYVEWPEAAFASGASPIRICLMGESGFAQVLVETVSGRAVGTRPVDVSSIANLEGAAGCHLLFFDDSVAIRGAVVANRLGTSPIFTISDRPGFAEDGGIANFVLVDQKIRFEINQGAARQAGLKISSSLLRLAKLVGEARG
jgi:hypothetical protein